MDPLDTLIDDVARRMTSLPTGPIGADMAGRVSARIADDEARRERRVWRRQWVFAPAAAACVLVLAVFVAREKRPAPVVKKPDATVAGTTLPPQPAAVNATPEPQPRAVVEPPARRTQFEAAPFAALPQDFAVAPMALPAIAEIERIPVAPLAPGGRIDITTIAIEQIEISPME